jgi:hypothetical protein
VQGDYQQHPQLVVVGMRSCNECLFKLLYSTDGVLGDARWLCCTDEPISVVVVLEVLYLQYAFNVVTP